MREKIDDRREDRRDNETMHRGLVGVLVVAAALGTVAACSLAAEGLGPGGTGSGGASASGTSSQQASGSGGAPASSSSSGGGASSSSSGAASSSAQSSSSSGGVMCAPPVCMKCSDCTACLTCQVNFPGLCSAQADACKNNQECVALSTCLQGCGNNGCINQCNMNHSQGKLAYDALQACLKMYCVPPC